MAILKTSFIISTFLASFSLKAASNEVSLPLECSDPTLNSLCSFIKKQNPEIATIRTKTLHYGNFHHQISTPNPSPYNGECQEYTNSPDNSGINLRDGGFWIKAFGTSTEPEPPMQNKASIKPAKKIPPKKMLTKKTVNTENQGLKVCAKSARLVSQPISLTQKSSNYHGAIEFNMTIPYNYPWWSAAWLLGSKGEAASDDATWPSLGELDLFEAIGQHHYKDPLDKDAKIVGIASTFVYGVVRPGKTPDDELIHMHHSTSNYDCVNPIGAEVCQLKELPGRLGDEFHRYGAEWEVVKDANDPEKNLHRITFYIDGSPYFRIENDKEMNLTVNDEGKVIEDPVVNYDHTNTRASWDCGWEDTSSNNIYACNPFNDRKFSDPALGNAHYMAQSLDNFLEFGARVILNIAVASFGNQLTIPEDNSALMKIKSVKFYFFDKPE